MSEFSPSSDYQTPVTSAEYYVLPWLEKFRTKGSCFEANASKFIGINTLEIILRQV